MTGLVHWTRRDVAQLLGIAVLIALVVAAWRLTVSAQRATARAADREAVAAGVQADIAVGHVWLEEHLAGDRTVDVLRDVRGPVDAAVAGCRALRDGGVVRRQRIPAVEGSVRPDVVEACRRVDTVRVMTERRLSTGAQAGTPADRRFDRAFRGALVLVERMPALMRGLSDREEARLRRLEIWAIVALAVALLLAAKLIRRGERRLARMVQERESVLEFAGEGILALDPDGTIRFANMAASVLLGRRSEELTGRPLGELVPHRTHSANGAPPDWLTPGPRRRTAQLRQGDGTVFPIEYTATSAEPPGAGGAIVLTFRDITARRRREREREIELRELRAIRETLVPADVRKRPELDVSTCFVAAESGVAGDFYLVADGLDGTTVLVVGDVAGKGVAAAQRAAFVRTTLATFAAYTDSPARLLELANRALVERRAKSDMLVTAVCAVVQPAAASVTWAVAGHPPPLRLDHGTPFDGPRGLPLGLEDAIGAKDVRATLPPGAGFVLFTDGLSEARAPENDPSADGAVRFGAARIRDVVAGLHGADTDHVVRALRSAAEGFSRGALADDLCIVAVRATGARAATTRAS
jgi:PAS domain S-box-containing protein